MIWLAIAGCTVASFIFAGIEAGLLSINRVRLHHFARQRDGAALRLERLLQKPERGLITALIITNLLNIFAVVMSTRELVMVYGQAGYLIALAGWLPVYLFILQLLPKALFRRFPYRALASVAPLMQLADLLLSPVVAFGSGLIDLLYPAKRKQEKRLFVAREDIRYFSSEIAKGGELTSLERAMIHNVLDFRQVRAADLMAPIDKVETIRAEASVADLMKLSREKRLDHVPVASDGGRIDGLVDVFQVLMEPNSEKKPVSFYLRRLPQTPAGEPAIRVMEKLRAARAGLAAVVDASGRTIGIVNSRDLMRRLVTAREAKA